jgi:DNA-binding MarR family transcriptional regulator
MAYPQLALQSQLCFRLYTASRLITQAYEPLLRPLGLTYTQYLVLMVLWEHDGQPVNDIGKQLMLGINTTSPLIKRMEAQGLVTRHDSTTDKRQQIVCLTPKGRRLEKKAAEVPGCMMGTLDECGLKTDDLKPLVPLLDRLIDKITARKEAK